MKNGHLHRHDVDRRRRLPKKSPDLIFQINLGIDPVELIKVDAVHLEAPKAPFARLSQVLRASVFDPPSWSRPNQTAFGRDDHTCRVWMERLSNQAFGDIGAIGVGGIEKVNAQIDGPSQHRDRSVSILRFPPYPRTGQPHGAEPESMHGGDSTDPKAAAATREVPTKMLDSSLERHPGRYTLLAPLI